METPISDKHNAAEKGQPHSDMEGEIEPAPKASFRMRIRHFTFAWYTLTMSTGGISLLMALAPYRFPGLDTIGLVIFLLDLACFSAITACLVARFVLYPAAFSEALTRPAESLFVSTPFLTISALLCNLEQYGHKFLADTAALDVALRVLFWVYAAATFLLSIAQCLLLFTARDARRLRAPAMTPAWILPVFPVMLAGTLAGFFGPAQPPAQSLALMAAGLAAQGLGLLVSVFLYAAYLTRLVAHGLPAQRPAMFIAVGPPSFTAAALVAMADDVPRVFASIPPSLLSPLADISSSSSSSDVAALAAAVQLVALLSSVFLWGLAFWFFTLALAAVCAGVGARFRLGWWSLVFPNVGLAIACLRLGAVFGSPGMLWFSTAMILALVVVWGFLLWRSVRAVLAREIVWPGRDEDAD